MGKVANIADWERDREKSRDGVPVEIGQGRTIWVRRAGGHNERYKYETARVTSEQFARIQSTAEGTPERDMIYNELQVIVDAYALVARWEGFEDTGGEAVECTPDEVLSVFERCPEIHQLVQEQAADVEAYRLSRDTKSVSGGGDVAEAERGELAALA